MLTKREMRVRDGLVNGVEAADLLGTSVDSFRAMCRRGTFDVSPLAPSDHLLASLSTRPLWRREDVLAWAESRPVDHPAGGRW